MLHQPGRELRRQNLFWSSDVQVSDLERLIKLFLQITENLFFFAASLNSCSPYWKINVFVHPLLRFWNTMGRQEAADMTRRLNLN